MDRCPICRGRISDNAKCQRCCTDLSLLFQTEQEAKDLLRQTFNCISNGKYTQAEVFLNASQFLSFSEFKQNLLGFIQDCRRNAS